jgi:hypothetical protein
MQFTKGKGYLLLLMDDSLVAGEVGNEQIDDAVRLMPTMVMNHGTETWGKKPILFKTILFYDIQKFVELEDYPKISNTEQELWDLERKGLEELLNNEGSEVDR